MRGLKRNETTFWYCLPSSEAGEAVIDEYGNETSELIPHYQTAVAMKANVSPATGQSQTEQFGNLDSYDKVIVTCDMSCLIDENTVLFIDKEPEYAAVTVRTSRDAGAEETTVMIPVYDYVVRRVAKSLNTIAIAVRKVKVQ